VLNQTARVPLPAAWYGVPGFWHMNGVTLAMAIIANNRDGNQLPAAQRHAKPAEASGSITVSEPDAR
jgi:hypothetical protein